MSVIDPKSPVEVPPVAEPTQPEQPTTVAKDQRVAQAVRQAMKDDQALASDARNIVVIAKDGKITLNGTVSTTAQVNLAGNTAEALGSTDKVDNNLEVK